MKHLGSVIRRRRKEAGLKLDQVADQIPGYDAGNLSRFERGQQDITEDKLHKLAEILATNVADLYAEAAGKPRVQELSAQWGILDADTQRLLSAWRKLPRPIRQHYLAIMEHMPAPSAEVVNKLPMRRAKKKAG